MIFVKTRENLAQGFEFSLKMTRIMHFFYFQKKILKIFSKFSQTIVFFVKTGENLTRGFEIILKVDQNNAFFAIF